MVRWELFFFYLCILWWEESDVWNGKGEWKFIKWDLIVYIVLLFEWFNLIRNVLNWVNGFCLKVIVV